jgi:hypothetical protein
MHPRHHLEDTYNYTAGGWEPKPAAGKILLPAGPTAGPWAYLPAVCLGVEAVVT